MIGLKDKWENQEPGIQEEDNEEEETKEEPIKEVDQKEYLNDFLTGIENDLIISDSIEKMESFKEIEELEKNVKKFNLKAELKRLESLKKSEALHKNASEIKISKINHDDVLKIFQ